MKTLRGLSKANTIRLVEIEHYVKTGTRPDGMHVTDEWVDDSIAFLARELRPTLEAWASISDDEELSSSVAREARKVYRLWSRHADQDNLDQAFEALGKAIEAAEKVPGE